MMPVRRRGSGACIVLVVIAKDAVEDLFLLLNGRSLFSFFYGSLFSGSFYAIEDLRNTTAWSVSRLGFQELTSRA